MIFGMRCGNRMSRTNIFDISMKNYFIFLLYNKSEWYLLSSVWSQIASNRNTNKDHTKFANHPKYQLVIISLVKASHSNDSNYIETSVSRKREPKKAETGASIIHLIPLLNCQQLVYGIWSIVFGNQIIFKTFYIIAWCRSSKHHLQFVRVIFLISSWLIFFSTFFCCIYFWSFIAHINRFRRNY